MNYHEESARSDSHYNQPPQPEPEAERARPTEPEPVGNFYAALGVDSSASPDEIKRAFRSKALESHPDRDGEQTPAVKRWFQGVTEAYNTLKDPAARAKYDVNLLREQQASASRAPEPKRSSEPTPQPAPDAPKYSRSRQDDQAQEAAAVREQAAQQAAEAERQASWDKEDRAREKREAQISEILAAAARPTKIESLLDSLRQQQKEKAAPFNDLAQAKKEIFIERVGAVPRCVSGSDEGMFFTFDAGDNESLFHIPKPPTAQEKQWLGKLADELKLADIPVKQQGARIYVSAEDMQRFLVELAPLN